VPLPVLSQQNWGIAPLEDVRNNMQRTNYPSEQIEYVVGDVCQTLPASRPRPIALLRLDTDWYESTRCELEHLFDSLQPGGSSSWTIMDIRKVLVGLAMNFCTTARTPSSYWQRPNRTHRR
jgi:hypothetical protein